MLEASYWESYAVTIDDMWTKREEIFREIGMLNKEADELKKLIEISVAKKFGVKQALMSRISNCRQSPTGHCFTNPNDDNWHKCIYCGRL